ncbi:MAG: hypothetical protein EXS15_00075 [Phycisphaerales bacterium]|nr:hypothetical protein [Phycisphaerales bacterium]
MVPIFFYVACAMSAAGLALLLMPQGRTLRFGASIMGLAGIAWILVQIVRSIGAPSDALAPIGVLALCAFVSVASAVRVITHHRPVFCALYFVLVVVSSAAVFVLLSAEFVAFSLIIVYAGAILITYLFVLMLAQQSPADIGSTDAVEYDRIQREPASAVIAGFVILAVLGGSVFRVHESNPPATLDQDRAIRQGWRDLALMPTLLLAQARQADATVTAVVRRGNGQFVAVQSDHSAILSVVRANQSTPTDLTLPPALLPDNTSRVGMALVTRFPVSLELAGIILLMAMFGAVVLARRHTMHGDDEKRALAASVAQRDNASGALTR